MWSIREYGMNPSETVQKAYEIWKEMNFEDKIQYFLKCNNSEKERNFNFEDI